MKLFSKKQEPGSYVFAVDGLGLCRYCGKVYPGYVVITTEQNLSCVEKSSVVSVVAKCVYCGSQKDVLPEVLVSTSLLWWKEITTDSSVRLSKLYVSLTQSGKPQIFAGP